MLTCLVSREEPHVERGIKCKIESLGSAIMGHMAEDNPTLVGGQDSQRAASSVHCCQDKHNLLARVEELRIISTMS